MANLAAETKDMGFQVGTSTRIYPNPDDRGNGYLLQRLPSLYLGENENPKNQKRKRRTTPFFSFGTKKKTKTGFEKHCQRQDGTI